MPTTATAHQPPTPPAQAELPGDLFVLSDLHLAAGAAPLTARVDPGENFFEDASFGRFLDDAWGRYCAGKPQTRAQGPGQADVRERGREGGEDGPPPGKSPLLVLNGDTFDFTRLTRVPRGDADLRAWSQAATRAGLPSAQTTLKALRARVGPRERRFGLGTAAVEADWKARTIAAGHPGFFAAIRRWVHRGGEVVLVHGNHDLELHWPAVRRALVAAIAAGDGTLDAGPQDLAVASRAVSFEPHGRAFANVWIEHGHRFEPTTSVPPAPTDPTDPERLRLPLGSLINIYLLNPVERWRPLLDNIKPVESALWAVFRYAPIASLGVLFRGATWLPRALRRYHLRRRSARALAVYLACLTFLWGAALVASTVTVLTVAGLFPAVTDWLSPRLAWFLLSFLLLWPTLGLLRDAWRRLRPQDRDAYPRAARDAALAALRPGQAPTATTGSRLYAVVGHTHAQDARRYLVQGDQGATRASTIEVLVLNSGTWIPIVDTSLPGAAAALPRTRRPFIHLTLGAGPGPRAYTHEHLQWDDARGEPARSLLLARE